MRGPAWTQWSAWTGVIILVERRYSNEMFVPLPIAHQTIKTIVLGKLEFPQEFHAGRRKRPKAGANQRRNLSSRKRFHTVLSSCQITFQGRQAEIMVRPRFDHDCSAIHTSPFLLIIRTQDEFGSMSTLHTPLSS